METPDVAAFYAHLDECDQCNERQTICLLAEELLLEAAEDLNEDWQDAARKLREAQIRRKEADANCEFYKNCEEP